MQTKRLRNSSNNKTKKRGLSVNTYDYIIIGAGAAGSVIAARLGENKNNKILVLESGHDNRLSSKIISSYDKILESVPIKDGIYLRRYHNNPDKKKCGGLEVSPSLTDYVTVKQKKRYFAYPRGNGAGGSTGHHSMYDGRGAPYVYDRIAKLTGDDIWSYKNILPYYIKMESYNVPNANPAIHGNKGWLQIRKNCKMQDDLAMEMVKVFVDDMDVPYRHDPSDPAQVRGVFLSEEQVGPNGKRSNSFIDLLEPLMKKQNNIEIKFNSLVKNVLIEKENNDLCAKGVVVYNKPYLNFTNITGNKINDKCNAVLPDKTLPKETIYYARKNVIICSGSIATPQLLMLSGIGPKKHLDEIGIKTLVDLPGVGQNLIDHPFCSVVYEMDPKKIMWEWQATEIKQNSDYKNLADPDIISIIERYANPKSSENNAMALGWDWNSGLPPNNINEPDVHIQIANRFFFDPNCDFYKYPKGDTYHELEHSRDSFLPDVSDPINYSKGIPNLKPFFIDSQVNPKNPKVFLSFLPELLNIKNIGGSITLKNKDPRECPLIDLKYANDDEGVERLARMILKIREFMHKPGMLKYALDANNYEMFPGNKCNNLESIKSYLKNWQLYGYHIAGTSRMGKPDDVMSVVDSRLRVHGVKNLRVVDASVYPAPHLHAFNISRGVYLIAEVTADFIKKENI
jgi:choline dehydrogenase-like flavoprotein